VAAFATLGALIVRRAGNVIGWIMLAAGAAQAFLTIASAYAVIGLATFPGSLPAAKQVGTLAECSFAAVVFTVAFMFLLFPTGTLPSRRWGQLDLTEAVDRMVSVLASATGADRAEAWIRVGTELRPAAIWPRRSPRPRPGARGNDPQRRAPGVRTWRSRHQARKNARIHPGPCATRSGQINVPGTVLTWDPSSGGGSGHD
jgi:hypothetical protein